MCRLVHEITSILYNNNYKITMNIKLIAKTFIIENVKGVQCPILIRQNAEIFYLQSSVVIDTMTTDGGGITNQETVEFTDEVEAVDEGYYTPLDPLSSSDRIATADLATFLSRPVRLDSFTWLETDASDLTLRTINPWYSFFNDTRIKYKLNNFAFVRCDLKVKVMINASPFYYGCMGMMYQPLPALTPSTIIGATGQQRLMPLSQRPISYIYPHESMGAEMTLPFFLHKNWLDINTAQEFTDMGVLEFVTYTILRSANGVAGAGVTVQVYAWAENVELSGSTLSLALQSKMVPSDEYGSGPISGPASTIAKFASTMRTLPVIGKFATATEIGAKAISGIASLFGFTNVPVIDNVSPLQPRAFAHLASAEIGFPNDKLTLSAKNELTIDPTVVGAPPGDPLAIDSFVKRESFIIRTTWNTTNLVDDILFYSRVHPFMFRQTADTVNSIVDHTPMAIPTALFEGWRGDIIFRFKIIASPYHKGRLIISFDPQGDAVNNLVTVPIVSSAIYTQIVDIGEENDVEVRVPYNQALPFLRTETANTVATIPFSSSLTPTWNVVENRDNGAIIVRVLNVLTAPVATAPINILCYVRGADNMEFGNPRRPGQALTRFIVQSKEVPSEPRASKSFATSGPMTLPDQMRVNYGEVVKSLRVLLHRGNFVYTQRTQSATSAESRVLSTFGKLPPYYGYDPFGVQIATPTIGATNQRFNYVRTGPLQWLLPCFVGYRGSGVWTFNCASANSTSSVFYPSIKVVREPVNNMVWSDSVVSFAAPTSDYTTPYRDLTSGMSTAGGCALTNQMTQAGLSVLCPNYNLFKFNSTSPLNSTNAPLGVRTQDGSADDCFNLEVISASTSAQNLRVEKYWHAGPDFQPLFFLNVPSYYLLPTTPIPA